jgi:hypothetical protein
MKEGMPVYITKDTRSCIECEECGKARSPLQGQIGEGAAAVLFCVLGSCLNCFCGDSQAKEKVLTQLKLTSAMITIL